VVDAKTKLLFSCGTQRMRFENGFPERFINVKIFCTIPYMSEELSKYNSEFQAMEASVQSIRLPITYQKLLDEFEQERGLGEQICCLGKVDRSLMPNIKRIFEFFLSGIEYARRCTNIAGGIITIPTIRILESVQIDNKIIDSPGLYDNQIILPISYLVEQAKALCACRLLLSVANDGTDLGILPPDVDAATAGVEEGAHFVEFSNGRYENANIPLAVDAKKSYSALPHEVSAGQVVDQFYEEVLLLPKPRSSEGRKYFRAQRKRFGAISARKQSAQLVT
jgi:hypothetical protein